MKMKILHVSHHFYPCIGGVERIALEMCENLSKAGNDVSVACLNKCGRSDSLLQPHEDYKGVEINRVPFIDLKYYKIAPGVLKFAKCSNIIHIHGLGFFSDFLVLTKPLHRKPIVLSTHGGIFHTKRLSLLKKIYFFLWCRLIMMGVNRVLASSKNDFALFSKISKNSILLENGVSLERFESGRKKERNSFLFVGRISKNKRIDLLLECFKFLKNETPAPKLYIIGENFDNLEPALMEKAGELGLNENVFFVGRAEDDELLDYFSKSEFFISASEYEGFGISAIEAMASGCMPILNNIASFSNFVENGKNGFLVNFSEPELGSAVIMEIMNLSREKKREIVKNSLNSIQKYGWKSKIAKLNGTYKELKG